MKLLFKITLSIVIFLVALYWSAVFVLPSIKIVNNSGTALLQAKIELPDSYLDFGEIPSGESNTLHYSLSQQDGVYNFTFVNSNLDTNLGNCGYVTNNEINKRVVISVGKDNRVTCN